MVIRMDTLDVIRASLRRPNDEMSALIGLYTVDESNLSELEGCHRNVPSKMGVHLISIKWISCVFATRIPLRVMTSVTF